MGYREKMRQTKMQESLEQERRRRTGKDLLSAVAAWGLKDQSKFRSPGKMNFGIHKSKILLWHAEGGKEAEGSKGSCLSLTAHSHIES